jgi:hypothetical protein
MIDDPEVREIISTVLQGKDQINQSIPEGDTYTIPEGDSGVHHYDAR